MSDSPRKPFGHAKQSAPVPKPAPRPVAKAPPPPQFEVVEDEPADDGFEVVDEAPPPKKALKTDPKKALKAEPESKTKAKIAKRAEPEDDDDFEDQPKKKKKRKVDALSKQLLQKQDEDEARRAEALKHFEYTIPIGVLFIGVVMSVVGAFGAAKGVSGIFAFTALCAFVAIYVPLCIGALMVIGVLLGINYGRLWPAVLKIASITFVINGVWLLGDWLRISDFIILPINCFISFGLFMTLFDLDTWETNSSTGVLNLLGFVANIILIGFIVVADAATSGGGSTNTEEDTTPREERRERRRDRDKKPLDPNVPPPAKMPDDDDFDE